MKTLGFANGKSPSQKKIKKEFDELRKCAYKPHLVDGLKNESSTELKTEEERETSRSASLKETAEKLISKQRCDMMLWHDMMSM